MTIRYLCFACFVLLALGATSCASKNRKMTGIADEYGMITNNTRKLSKDQRKQERKKAMQKLAHKPIIPDW
jgi:hypothetical protein